MKELINGKVYDTSCAYLMKCVGEVEELGDGYVRYKTRNIYFRERSKDYFLYTYSVSTDNRSMVIDVNEYILPVSSDYAKTFCKGTREFYDDPVVKRFPKYA